MREASSHLETVVELEGDEIIARICGLFLAGVEFGLRFGVRYPQHLTELVDWCDKIPSDYEAPLEIRERDMQMDAQQIVEGCDMSWRPSE
jgi:hypothetical protein